MSEAFYLPLQPFWRGRTGYLGRVRNSTLPKRMTASCMDQQPRLCDSRVLHPRLWRGFAWLGPLNDFATWQANWQNRSNHPLVFYRGTRPADAC